MNRVLLFLIFVAVVLVVLFFPLTVFQLESYEKSGSPASFFGNSTLALSGTPSLNNPFTLTYTVHTPYKPLPNWSMLANASMLFVLPESFELVSGNLSWNGSIQDDPLVLRATVKATKVGIWVIGAVAGPDWHPGDRRDVIWVKVRETGGEVVRQPGQCIGRLVDILFCTQVPSVQGT